MRMPSFDLQDIADNLLALLKEGAISEKDFHSVVGNSSELFEFFRVFAFEAEEVVERILQAEFSPEVESNIFGMEGFSEFVNNCAKEALNQAKRQCPQGSDALLEDLAVESMDRLIRGE